MVMQVVITSVLFPKHRSPLEAVPEFSEAENSNSNIETTHFSFIQAHRHKKTTNLI